MLPIDYGPAADPHDHIVEPLVESIWVEPYPDERGGPEDAAEGPAARYERREAVELAFIAALQHLPARQRAVLILRDVLGFSAREAGDVLGISPPAIDSALQRAHKTVDGRLPEQSQQAALSVVGDARLRAIVDGYMAAWERADVAAVVALLAEDATLAMPPWSEWYAGRAAIAEFLARWPFALARWRLVPTRANGQLAFGHYAWDAGAGFFVPSEISVLTLAGEQIADLTLFRDPELIRRFGLPERMD